MTELKQASWQYQKMTTDEKETFVENVAESLMFVDENIQQTVLNCFRQVDESLETNLRKRLSFNLL